MFYKFRDVILLQVPSCSIKLRNDLCRNLPRVWAHHFALDKDKDVAFEVFFLVSIVVFLLTGGSLVLWAQTL